MSNLVLYLDLNPFFFYLEFAWISVMFLMQLGTNTSALKITQVISVPLFSAAHHQVRQTREMSGDLWKKMGKGAPDGYSLVYFPMTSITPLKPDKGPECINSAPQTPLVGPPFWLLVHMEAFLLLVMDRSPESYCKTTATVCTMKWHLSGLLKRRKRQ